MIAYSSHQLKCLHRFLKTGNDKDSVILFGKLFQSLTPSTLILCEQQVNPCDIVAIFALHGLSFYHDICSHRGIACNAYESLVL